MSDDADFPSLAELWRADLPLALRLADQADEITMTWYRSPGLQVQTKADRSPVTDADRDTEALLRSELTRERPEDAVTGEEFGATGHARRRWVLDPVDGTKNYVRGVPVWATLIALLEDDVPVVGVVSAPALDRRWWASAGQGAWTMVGRGDVTRCQVSDVDDIGQASLSYSSLSGWEERGLLDGFLDLNRAVWRTRAFGDFWSHLLVAEGAVDIACEPEVSLWDLAALSVIVTEAGGRFTDLSGRPGPHGGSALTTNGHLHEAALEFLRD